MGFEGSVPDFPTIPFPGKREQSTDERHNSVAIGWSRNGLNRNELHNWR